MEKDGSPDISWDGNGKKQGDQDGSPEKSDPSKWSGGGRGLGGPGGDGGPYKDSELGFSKE